MTNRIIYRGRGVTIFYVTAIMTAMMLFASLAADVARVQLAKTQLRSAVDGAARYGALGLDTDHGTAINNAVAAASQKAR